jgi:cytochrome c peroxidase
MVYPRSASGPPRWLGSTGLGLTTLGAAFLLLAVSCSGAPIAFADGGGGSGGGGGGLAPLATVPPPQPTGGTILATADAQRTAVQLGKALFWDIQVGGDGKTACASCHFFAGSDTRLLNTVNPGPDGIFNSLGVTGPGQLARLINIPATGGARGIGSDDRRGSQGVASADFVSVDPNPADAADICNQTPGSTVFGTNRQVTGRRVPSMINAVFNRDNFWDGRANHDFNGFNPFGNTANNTDGNLVNMTNSSLASQSVGPPNNNVEMSCAHRPFNGSNSLAAKMLARRPLQFQRVSENDGVLGLIADPAGTGLTTTYGKLIEGAFGVPEGSAEQVSQFSSFWGQAVQAYMSTLISDQTPMDHFLAGDRSALTSNQQSGMGIFTSGKGKCAACHAGPEMTDASASFYELNGAVNVDGGDTGFHNTGVRPTSEDLGRGGAGPQGVSWSISGHDRGAFKTPGLRNVGLKSSFFHNGGKATLTDVVNFYARGGDFANPERSTLIKRISFSAQDVNALVDFLQNGLTDCRVARELAPFDHPALPMNNGSDLPATGGGSC